MSWSNNELFYKLAFGGKYAKPFLLKFSCLDLTPIYLVNNVDSIEYNGETYEASSFQYVPPNLQGEGATLKISAVENNLIEFVENADENIRIDVVGIIAENGEVQALRQYSHSYGSASYDSNMEVTFTLETDDRLDMTFPPYKFDTDTNRGNT